jgi:hypothetical protein
MGDVGAGRAGRSECRIRAAAGPGRVTRVNYHRIKEGMARAEVEDILGPPGDYRTGPMSGDGGDWSADNLLLLWNGSNFSTWCSDAGVMTVIYDDSAKVLDKVLMTDRRQEQSPLENFLWRTKRQWRRRFP